MRSIFALLLPVLLSLPASAATWRILPGGTGDAPTIQAGIGMAAVGDTIELGAGTYTGPGNREIDFGGKEVVVRSELGESGASSTVIDAEGLGRGFRFHSGENLLARLEGIRITRGYADSLGGGVLVENGSMVVMNRCIVDSCVAAFRGGGIGFQGGGYGELYRCEFAWNHAGENGGGVDCFESSPVLDHCDIHHNSAGDHTGGVVCHTSSAGLTGCTITDNTCGQRGGGLSIWDLSSPMLTDCVISSNSAGSRGGGVHIQNSMALIFTTVIDSNSSGERGGGVSIRTGSQAHIGACRIRDNESVEDGGGIDCYESDLTLIGCEVARNHAGLSGGGLLGHQASMKIRECAIFANRAEERGGGLSCWVGAAPVVTKTLFDRNSAGGGGGALHFRGSSILAVDRGILSNSSEGEAVSCEDGTGSIALTCTDIHGNAGGDWTGCIAGQAGTNGNFSEDPLFCDALSGDYALCADSPCAAPPECGPVGPFGIGCDPCGATSAEHSSWGGVKRMFR